MSLAHEEIISIMKMFRESQFNNLHLEDGGFKLILSKDGLGFSGAEPQPGAPAPRPQGETLPETPPPEAAPAGACTPEADELDRELIQREGLVVFKSPMLGVFYRAPSPGAAPFVSEGSRVIESSTLCIIEVMKLYTSVAADMKGGIVKIYVEDGQMVEYGQPLFLIKPGTQSEAA